MASQSGLAEITLGTLATQSHLSKSGVFAHFRSRDDLLLAILHHGEQVFREAVVIPALQSPPGLQRLRAVFTLWLDWAQRSGLPGGCPFVAAAAAYDDIPGIIHDDLVRSQRLWLRALTRFVQEAISTGELRPDVDPAQLGWEIFGVYLMHHFAARLLNDTTARSRALAAFEEKIRHA